MRPVFIGGASRSGTTLLGAMLGMGRDCITVPESQFKIDILRSLERGPGAIDSVRVLDMLIAHRRFRIWSLALEAAAIPRESIGSSYPRLLEWAVGRYGEKVGKADCGIWIDHTPENIKYATTLLDLFPEAVMIHMVRDGRAVAASIMPLDWGPNTIVGAARDWVESIGHGLAVECALKSKCIRISYESLVTAPEDTLRAVCRHISVEYQPCMVEARGFKVPEYSAAQHSLIGARPDPARVNSWKKELSRREIEIFEGLAGDILAYFGYGMEFGTRARPPTGRELFACQVRELFETWCLNRFRFHRRTRRALRGGG
ncbi:MAG: sulfotransferase [bacterium]